YENYTYLPRGGLFNTILSSYLSSNNDITKVKFVTNSSSSNEESPINHVFFIKNNNTLEIHTPSEKFLITSCGSMFRFLSNLTSIDIGNSLNTSLTTSMAYMFSGCSSLEELNLNSLDTQNTTSMYCMFAGCSSLRQIDVTNFKTENVERIVGMFMGCSSLQSLDLSSFDTKKCDAFSVMFKNCSSLITLDLSSFDSQNVTDIYHMFYNCSSLTTLYISNFNTNKVIDMGGAFSGCLSLNSLDLSSFSFDATPYVNGIFENIGQNATNKPISIYITGAGKTFMENHSNYTKLNSDYAQLVEKNTPN
ncbi:MAG: BspA family leucine-rich repeat surface protein, partial [Bacteroidales bacterium]|nr:BspA family leucine-rich repeat surface protein [Bacteroidales bacterium]